MNITDNNLLQKNQLNLNISYTYPDDPDYDFYVEHEKIDLDNERIHDILTGNGFIVAEPSKSIKKDLKHQDGIFSIRFGQSLGDLNPCIDKYRCQCGYSRSRIYNGTVCEKCGTLVEYLDDKYNYFGWIVIKEPYVIIHPLIYKQIEIFLGMGNGKRSKLENIIDYVDTRSIDGHIVENEKKTKDEPFFGKGMMYFYENFDSIMEYYKSKEKNQEKIEYYNDIMLNRKKVFTHSIPVFTTLLRGLDVKGRNLFYEPINGLYQMLNALQARINNTKTAFSRKLKIKNQLLYKMQMKTIELYEEIEKIISSKKGQIRSLLGGRFSFSARAVIIQNPTLRVDQCTLPYTALVILLQQRIINILHRIYNIGHNQAYDIWYKASIVPDDKIIDIINSIIKSYPYGLPIIINRNPTIAYGSIMQMFCIGLTKSFTIGIPLRILKSMGADFDGDEYNLFTIINDAFFEHAFMVFNPRNAMHISRNDGLFNMDLCIQRDTVINANTLMWMGRKYYSEDQIKLLQSINTLYK